MVLTGKLKGIQPAPIRSSFAGTSTGIPINQVVYILAHIFTPAKTAIYSVYASVCGKMPVL
jgi:hypothetical protein